jgi:hypothetical protein
MCGWIQVMHYWGCLEKRNHSGSGQHGDIDGPGVVGSRWSVEDFHANQLTIGGVVQDQTGLFLVAFFNRAVSEDDSLHVDFRIVRNLPGLLPYAAILPVLYFQRTPFQEPATDKGPLGMNGVCSSLDSFGLHKLPAPGPNGNSISAVHERSDIANRILGILFGHRLPWRAVMDMVSVEPDRDLVAFSGNPERRARRRPQLDKEGSVGSLADVLFQEGKRRQKGVSHFLRI